MPFRSLSRSRPVPALLWGPLDDRRLLLAQASQLDVNFDATRSRWVTAMHELRLGRGDAVFGSARMALAGWVPQARARIGVFPPDPPDVGRTLLMSVGSGSTGLVVANRIVGLVDEPGRYSYTYATLRGHPEAGVEQFEVEQLGSGDVVARLVVRTQRYGWRRALGPGLSAASCAVARVYLRSLVDAVQTQA